MELPARDRLSPGWWPLIAIILIAALPSTVAAQSLVADTGVTLPDVSGSRHGRPIGSVRPWYTGRRPELLRWFTGQMYGRSPGRPADLRFGVLDEDPSRFGWSATRKQVAVYFRGSDNPRMDILLYIPNRVQGPVPVLVGLNFSGNQTISADTAIRPPLFLPEGHSRSAWQRSGGL